MDTKVYQQKANQVILNDLHAKVATALANNLDDPKVLSNAIKFLKDNEITADLVDSEATKSLTQSIIEIANKEDTATNSMSVEDMLEIAD